ncbi:hypothetical protein K469DRAFT_687036 [Zopfia rhizophila CBS 207.26]|uniref:Uncharacterized protein n=1 Tax=Zopfia rhizophila CBS 207.26 TaxID=1314779 RepID=A0A6A6EA01_9PEZI|nr:hypothetical protein K469DRAFT_687036 [Zopfia rhizophila CBS 207.26]
MAMLDAHAPVQTELGSSRQALGPGTAGLSRLSRLDGWPVLRLCPAQLQAIHLPGTVSWVPRVAKIKGVQAHEPSRETVRRPNSLADGQNGFQAKMSAAAVRMSRMPIDTKAFHGLPKPSQSLQDGEQQSAWALHAGQVPSSSGAAAPLDEQSLALQRDCDERLSVLARRSVCEQSSDEVGRLLRRHKIWDAIPSRRPILVLGLPLQASRSKPPNPIR